ncbi:MAG TPA: HD domain-containing phosphohydrolase [Gallionellaceae bacterium]|nr:HD domain-containing phosphohydrolase [Gallionellaceae bacterium]
MRSNDSMRARGSARVHVGSALLLLVLWCAAAWLIASRHYVRHAQATVAEATQDAGSTARNIARSVAMTLDVMRGVPALVASQAAVQQASARFAAHGGDDRLPYAARKARWAADSTLNSVSRLLDRIKASVGTGSVFLLDAHGNCIASSDWGVPESRVGKAYSGRPFFRDGLQGGGTADYGFDAAGNAPALFFSAPVRAGGVTRGVVVVTMDMPGLRFMISTDAGYISDANGVIVIAQDAALLGHALPGAGVNVLPPRARRAIYGEAEFPPVRMTEGADGDFPTLVYFAGDPVPYVTASAGLGVYGMTAHVRDRMTALQELDHNKTWLGVLLAALGAIVILGANFATFSIHSLRREKRVLQESEARFRGLIEQSLTGIYVSQDGKIVYANPRMCGILGRPEDEVLGHDSAEFFRDDPQGMRTLLDSRARLAAGERSVSLVSPYTRPDGKRIEVGTHAALGLWGGRPAVFVLAADITERRRSEEQLADYVRQLEKAMEGTLLAVSNMVEHRDPYTAGHERRVGIIAADIAREMGWAERKCKELEMIGLVHDIGKIAVPVEILTKPGRLTAVEYDLVKEHAERGYQILKDVQFPLPIADIIRQHHERIDGSGYPQGLKGEEILPEARILAVADVVESMASFRPYRPALGVETALVEIESHRGTRYDTAVADALLKMIREKGYRLPA